MGADESELHFLIGVANDLAHRCVQSGAVGEGTLLRCCVSDPGRMLEGGADDAGQLLAAQAVHFIERNAHGAFVIAAASALKLFVQG